MLNLLQLLFGNTIYLISVVTGCWCFGASVCVASPLNSVNPPHVHHQISAHSPWKLSLTDYGVCLRRRPVLHSAHLTHRMSSGPATLSLLASTLTNLQTPLLQQLAVSSSPLRTSAPLLLRLVPPPQRCKIHSPALDRAPILTNVITLPLPLTTATPPR